MALIVFGMLGLVLGDTPAGSIHCVSEAGGPFAVDIDWQINDDIICFTLTSECDEPVGPLFPACMVGPIAVLDSDLFVLVLARSWSQYA